MLSTIKSFAIQNPATVSLTAANIAVHIYIHKLKKRTLDDVSTTGYSFFQDKERVKRTLWTLFSHADDSHLLYNLLHLWMYMPLLENNLVVSNSKNENDASSLSSSSSILKKIALTSSLYLITGGSGIFTFLKGIQQKYAKYEESDPGLHMTSQFIPLIGNSPAAYGLHALTMTLLLPPFSPSYHPTSYNRKVLPTLFALEAFLPPFLSLLGKQDIRQKLINNKSSKKDTSGRVPFKNRFMAFGITASSGLAHFYIVNKFVSDLGSWASQNVPAVSLSFFTYMIFRRFSLQVFSKVTKKLNVVQISPVLDEGMSDDGTETSCDDHFGHFGGAVSGCVIGLILNRLLNNNSDKTSPSSSMYTWLAPALTMGELTYCAVNQMLSR